MESQILFVFQFHFVFKIIWNFLESKRLSCYKVELKSWLQQLSNNCNIQKKSSNLNSPHFDVQPYLTSLYIRDKLRRLKCKLPSSRAQDWKRFFFFFNFLSKQDIELRACKTYVNQMKTTKARQGNSGSMFHVAIINNYNQKCSLMVLRSTVEAL